jgi:hypothetical protein
MYNTSWNAPDRAWIVGRRAIAVLGPNVAEVPQIDLLFCAQCRGIRSLWQPVVKVDSCSLFKKLASKAQEKVKAEAYLAYARV